MIRFQTTIKYHIILRTTAVLHSTPNFRKHHLYTSLHKTNTIKKNTTPARTPLLNSARTTSKYITAIICTFFAISYDTQANSSLRESVNCCVRAWSEIPRCDLTRFLSCFLWEKVREYRALPARFFGKSAMNNVMNTKTINYDMIPALRACIMIEPYDMCTAVGFFYSGPYLASRPPAGRASALNRVSVKSTN